MLVLSGRGNESTRKSAGEAANRRRAGWRALILLAACASAACAEAPGGTEFLIKLDSGSQTPDVDAGMPPIDNEPPPANPGGGTPGFTVPPFQQQDASAPAPAVDASRPPPTPDAGRPPTNPPMTTPDASQPPPPPPVDSGPVVTPQPEAGMPPPSGQTCGTTPAFATPDACTKCICMRCASQVMSCYASTDTAKNASCKMVRDCALQNRCTGDRCYCGDAFLCVPPSGPCEQQITSAAAPLDVTTAANDLENPLGRSNAVGMCSMSSCATECGL